MYRRFIQKYTDQSQIKECLYCKIFSEELNLGFAYPHSDTCEKCDLLKVSIDSERSDKKCEELQVELAEHQEKAAQGYQSLRYDTATSRGDENSLVITFDLQQNLPVPTLTHGSMFYLRQLWVYNFGINVCSGDSYMCVWNECVAGRGSNEIISCLLEYFSKHQLNQAKKLICYSDGCFGQNKNIQMICFWI